MNLPGAVVDLPTLTQQDELDIVEFGLNNGIDFIAASFVRKASDVQYIRDLMGEKGKKVQIISKIENQEGLQNYEEILEASDGIMVARGDLGMEIPPEKVFIAQKWMIEKANLVAKPVVTATQMLESMIKAPRPTRAEASDVANAVLDGTDCVMLSGESAGGDYPINAVTIMSKICVEAEKTLNYKLIFNNIKLYTAGPFSTNEAVSSAVVSAAIDQPDIGLIVVLTETGNVVRLVSKYRPQVKIVCASTNAQTLSQTNCLRGVIPLQIDSLAANDALFTKVCMACKEQKLVKTGSNVAFIHGTNEETPDESNIMKIVDA